MGRYMIRRVLQFVPVLFGTTFLIFAGVFSLAGDPIRALSGDRPIAASAVEQLRDEYNLDDPLLVQYGKYMGVLPDDDSGEFSGLLTGDFGVTLARSPRPVAEVMADKIPISARLAIYAFIIEAIIGIFAGVLAALRKDSFLDTLVQVSTVVVISVPIFVLGLVAQYAFGVELGLLPVAGIQEGFRSYIMPSFILAATSLAYIARLTRTAVVENNRADYVRTAKAKGLPARRVVGIHTLRNSLIPVVTFLAVDLGALMGGAIITETIFNIPGVGREVFDAVTRQDGALVVGIVTFLIVVYMVANLLVDFLYAVLDPRIRYE
ncbi:ABC transporter permease [Euzebya tangerina]|uniref:ABC transporter permease n=1 Tax=Euzebya tangerina TaxID=591198 RepID=UPI000E323307|nr:ABC transporter permease [Euzebya tangerina]